jgi:DNA polymerase III epsilon subunit-like protein
MVYFAIDTETTGLPTSRAKPTPSNISHYDSCRMLSLAIIEYSDDHKEEGAHHFIVKPDGFEVGATHIHGITQEMAESQGLPFEDIYNTFIGLLFLVEEECKIVGHNLDFDLNVIRAEFIRHEKCLEILDKVKPICTLKLYRRVFLKPIKLTLLYKEIFNKELDGAHNALNDARGAGEVYPYLLKDTRNFRPIEKKRVIIKASEVAACIGVNTYRPIFDVLSDIWKKNNPKNFKGLTRDEKNQAAVNASADTKILFDHAMAEVPENSDQVQSLVHKTMEAVEKDETLSPQQKKMVGEHMRKMLYTTHGTRSEDATANLDESKLHEDNKFYSHTITSIEGTTYEIVGRIDRYQIEEDGSKTLVEIKNRTRCLFKNVRDYEMIQVQVYLQMMGLSKARLIEQFNNERLSYPIDLNQYQWDNQILPNLTEFCKTLHHYMSN